MGYAILREYGIFYLLRLWARIGDFGEYSCIRCATIAFIAQRATQGVNNDFCVVGSWKAGQRRMHLFGGV